MARGLEAPYTRPRANGEPLGLGKGTTSVVQVVRELGLKSQTEIPMMREWRGMWGRGLLFCTFNLSLLLPLAYSFSLPPTDCPCMPDECIHLCGINSGKRTAIRKVLVGLVCSDAVSRWLVLAERLDFQHSVLLQSFSFTILDPSFFSSSFLHLFTEQKVILI